MTAETLTSSTLGVEDAADVDATNQRRRADDVTESRGACVDEQGTCAGHVTLDADARARKVERANHCHPGGRLPHNIQYMQGGPTNCTPNSWP